MLAINKGELGSVIENKNLDFQTNQISINLGHLKKIPNVNDFYLVSFRGIRGYHRLVVTKIPDENNLLTFTVQKSGNLSHVSDLVTPGTKVRVKGPFSNSTKKVS